METIHIRITVEHNHVDCEATHESGSTVFVFGILGENCDLFINAFGSSKEYYQPRMGAQVLCAFISTLTDIGVLPEQSTICLEPQSSTDLHRLVGYYRNTFGFEYDQKSHDLLSVEARVIRAYCNRFTQVYNLIISIDNHNDAPDPRGSDLFYFED